MFAQNSMLSRKALPFGRCLAAVGLLALLTTACAETELAVHTAKRLNEAGSPDAPGYYKVGKPYQIDGKWYYPKENFSYRESGIASWYGPGFHGKITANGELYDQHDMTAAHRTLPMPSVVRVTNLENGRSIKVRVNDRGPFAKNRIIDLSKRGAELLGFHTAGTAKVLVEILPNESQQAALLAQGRSQGKAASTNDQDEGKVPAAVPLIEVTSQELVPLGEEANTGQGASTPKRQNTQVAKRSTGTAEDSGSSQSITGRIPGAGDVALEEGVLVTRTVVQPSDIFVQAGSFAQVHNAERHKARLSGLAPTKIVEGQVGSNRYYRVYLGPLDDVQAADKMIALLEANGISDAQIVVD